MRLATAANRSSWVSATEMALMVTTSEHFWSTHYDVPIFLQKAICLIEECKRILCQTSTLPFCASGIEVGCVELESDSNADNDEIGSGPDVADESEETLDDDSVDAQSCENRGSESENSQPPEKNRKGISMRATSSAFDDWMHRGPYLRQLPFEMYITYIERVQKPKDTDHAHKYFLFDSHYEMARLYCQALRMEAVVGRLVGSDCPDIGKDPEMFAAHHLLLYFPAKGCPGAGGCADPVSFVDCLFQERKHKYRFQPIWKARRAEIKMLSQKAKEKIDRARKFPVIVDTTLFKSYARKLDPESMQKNAEYQLLQATLLQCLRVKWNCLMWQPYICLQQFLGIPSLKHRDQLHLEEFVAWQLVDTINNSFLQQISKKNPLSTNIVGAAATDSEDDVLDQGQQHSRVTEFLGGTGEDFQEIEDIDEFFAVDAQVRPDIMVTLGEAQTMLQRCEEIKRLEKPGRHKESDRQMQDYAEIFDECLSDSLMEVVHHAEDFKWDYISTNTMFQHQDAVSKLLRQQAVPVEEQPAKNAMEINTDEACPNAAIIDIPEVLQGPKCFAWRLLQQHHMTEEQIDCAALVVYPLQKAFESRSDVSSITLPLSGSLARLLIVGGGGCGKTTLLMKIMMPVLQTYLHGMLRTAPSNKAARSIGGRTCHNVSSLKPSDSLRTAALHLSNDNMRQKMEAIWTWVGSLAVDEFSQLQASLFHAMAVRSMYVRAGVHRLQLESYCQQSHLLSWAILYNYHLYQRPHRCCKGI